ncbi:hypothetical protein N657DRAFT_675393 [Parathielavia appendiculata]|uniref:Uncharacterized protein n=1 Tax=Parathielavia appendiculata TaxID=2587402 RepID=A0AAN6TQ88_9PEZI|nr:hypothetical protein N657DRAFT_675393 [Parathielavia appendiculata]
MAPQSFPQFQALPAEIQRHVFDMAAANAAADEFERNLISATHMVIYITEMPQKHAIPSTPDPRYYLNIDRTAEQEEARQPLLSLCPDARAAMAAKEVFEVTMLPWDLENLVGSSGLPIYSGATQELLITQPPPAVNEPRYNAKQVLMVMTHVFGTKNQAWVRRHESGRSHHGYIPGSHI